MATVDVALAPVSPKGPIREVLAMPAFRYFWYSQLLVATVSGTIRFAFVWLVLDLTDWSPAVSFIGLAVGLPMTLLSLPAGVLSDRHDRRRMVAMCCVAGAAVLVATGVLVHAELVGVGWVALLAFGIGSAIAVTAPALQAMVPALVPPERLVTGIALQGIGQNVAQMSGVLVGGLAIQLLGTAGAFELLAVMLLVAAGLQKLVPRHASGSAGQRAETQEVRMLPAIREGLGYVLGREPLRTVVAIAVVGGVCGGTVQLLLPAIAKDEIGVGALAAALLFGGLGLGMIATTLLLAARHGVNRPGLLLGGFFIATCGPGMILMGLTDVYAVVMAGMVIWGLGGGFVMTTQRMLLQRHTPDHLMGRVVSVHTLCLQGSFPIAAVLSALLVSLLGTSRSLVVMGTVSLVLAILLGTRRPLREA